MTVQKGLVCSSQNVFLQEVWNFISLPPAKQGTHRSYYIQWWPGEPDCCILAVGLIGTVSKQGLLFLQPLGNSGYFLTIALSADTLLASEEHRK